RPMADLAAFVADVEQYAAFPGEGAVSRIIGITAGRGGIDVRLGELCAIGGADGAPARAEASGVPGPATAPPPREGLAGLGPGAPVRVVGRRWYAPAGPRLLGRVVDGIGRPLDNGPGLRGCRRVPVDREAPSPAERYPIDEVCETG